MGSASREPPNHCREQPATEGVGLPSGAAEEQHRGLQSCLILPCLLCASHAHVCRSRHALLRL